MLDAKKFNEKKLVEKKNEENDNEKPTKKSKRMMIVREKTKREPNSIDETKKSDDAKPKRSATALIVSTTNANKLPTPPGMLNNNSKTKEVEEWGASVEFLLLFDLLVVSYFLCFVSR
jgi:hypothetical protein